MGDFLDGGDPIEGLRADEAERLVDDDSGGAKAEKRLSSPTRSAEPTFVDCVSAAAPELMRPSRALAAYKP
jgi:hypothetical protein